MTDRVARLRQQSLAQKPTLSSERAELMTAFYRDAPAAPLSAAVRANPARVARPRARPRPPQVRGGR